MRSGDTEANFGRDASGRLAEGGEAVGLTAAASRLRGLLYVQEGVCNVLI